MQYICIDVDVYMCTSYLAIVLIESDVAIDRDDQEIQIAALMKQRAEMQVVDKWINLNMVNHMYSTSLYFAGFNKDFPNNEAPGFF
jgi:hypothetical protein